ncbi:hypothetical protein NW754_002424 [Fusarium falciforme]|uniref:C2H2-type domain-containing protein n=1 Tax=Fusarium falciforme TaxID=195108 RepID=A0A9W8R3M3_9HYPO|nr:hypothetical protein NW754_002424 [Fusarium falciforme]KAJ4186789.1 hypothetical protein NW755_007521 [Fusarium falciforme]KAJ4196301.1 hypothetical protein NW767_009422 [Fusarium falciforme]KAJ4247541.1 hypothetical protein NW757_008693 [Fusarium falciforme]
MCSQTNVTVRNLGVTTLPNTARHPLIAVIKATCNFIHPFKPKRQKSALSNQASTYHCNFPVSSETAAATADVHPGRQAVGAFLTLDNELQHVSNAPGSLGSEGTEDLDKAKLINCKQLTLVILSSDRPPSNILRSSYLKLCDVGNDHVKTCAPSSAAPQRGRPTSGKANGKKGEQGQRKKKGADGKKSPDDGGNDGGKKRKWFSHPIVKDKRKLLDCPFHKHNAIQYHACRAYSRFCDLKKHIERRHFFSEDTNHCPRCRMEFSQGSVGKESRDEHMREEPSCAPLTVADTGMMLEEEYAPVRQELDKMAATGVSNEEKWNYLWTAIFGTDAPPHYIQDTTTIENAEMPSIQYLGNRTTQPSGVESSGTRPSHNYNTEPSSHGSTQVFGNHSLSNQSYDPSLDIQSSSQQYSQNYNGGFLGGGYPQGFDTQSLLNRPFAMQPVDTQSFNPHPSTTQYLNNYSAELSGSGNPQSFANQPFDTQPSGTRFSSTRSHGTYNAESLSSGPTQAFDPLPFVNYHPQALGMQNLSYRNNQFADTQPLSSHTAQFPGRSNAQLSDGDSFYSLSNADTQSLLERCPPGLEDSDAWTEAAETPVLQHRNRHRR